MPPVQDRVWMTNTGLMNGLLAEAKENKAVLFVCTFSDKVSQLETFLRSSGVDIHELQNLMGIGHGASIISAERLLPMGQSTGVTSRVKVIIVGHHPLLEKDLTLVNKVLPFTQGEPIFASSLDEPLFMLFGGERIQGLMARMGMDAAEFIQHSMLTSSIQNAQKKIAEKVLVDNAAPSAEEWFRRNYQRG